MAGQGTTRNDYCPNCLPQGDYVPLDRVGIFERCPVCGFNRVMGTVQYDPAGQYIKPAEE